MINYNSLFGTFSTNTDTGVTTATYVDIDAAKDYVFRETKLLKEIKHLSRSKKALEDPESYLDSKNEDLAKMGNDLTRKFLQTYSEYMERGFSQKESRIRALELVNSEKNKYMMVHLEQFPTRIRDTSMRDLKNKANDREKK